MCHLSGGQLKMRIVQETIEERLPAELHAAYRAAMARLDTFDEHRQRLLQVPMPAGALERRKRAYLIERELFLKPLMNLVAMARLPALLLEPPTR
jgi:hypothetical protein